MKKRLVAIVLTLAMVLSLLPATAFAYIGALHKENAEAMRSGTKQVGGYSMAYIENDYLHFEIDTSYGAVMRTSPTRTETATSSQDDINRGVYQQQIFSVRYRGQGEQSLSVQSASVVVKNETKTVDGRKMQQSWIEVNYTFVNSPINAKGVYQIVQLDEGKTTGTSTFPVYEDSADEGRTWGVWSSMDFTAGDSRTGNMYVNTKFMNFGYMGHTAAIAEGGTGAATYFGTVSGAKGDVTTTKINISGGVAKTKVNGTPAISEAFVDSYVWANAFVMGNGIGYTYGPYRDDKGELQWGIITGVDGYYQAGTGSLAEYFAYDSSTLTATTDQHNGYFSGMGDQASGVDMIWGYRGLYKSNDSSSDIDFTDSDYVDVSDSAAKLGIFKKDSGYVAEPISSDAQLVTLKKTYGDPVATYRGNYNYNATQGYYEFSNNNVALTSTVTATWGDSGGYFRVKKNGTVLLSNVSLNVPKFKFYQPYTAKNDGHDGLTFGYSDSGINIDIDYTNNCAIVQLDIGHATTTLKKALLKSDGNIEFSGGINFSTIFDTVTFSMEKLGLGPDATGTVNVNGVIAKGKISVGKILSMKAASIEGEINTFAGQEKYSFNMELDVFELFQAKAELELKRLNNGDLCPNNLYFALNVEKGPGIPLVAPAPIATLTGGGAGFSGLADTINGDYLAIPPVRLRGQVTGKILQVIEGSASYEFGPSGMSVKGEELAIPDEDGLKLIKSLGASFSLSGQSRNYNGTNYTGLCISHGASIDLSLLNAKEGDKNYNVLKYFNGVIQAGGSYQGSIYGGENASKNRLYVAIGMNGKVYGKLMTPEAWWLIGGRTIASATLDFALGAQTVINLDGSTSSNFASVFDNLSVYGGVAFTGNIGKIYGRIYYIIPDQIDYDLEWGSMPEWSWDSIQSGKKNIQATLQNAQTDEQVGVMGATVPLTQVALLSKETAAQKSGGTVSHTLAVPSAQVGTQQLILAVIPSDDTVQIDTFAASVTVGGKPVVLMQTDENGVTTNESTYNAWVGTYKTVDSNQDGKIDETDTPLKAVFVALNPSDLGTVGGDGNYTQTVSAASDFSGGLYNNPPLASLQASLSSNTLTASVQNPETDESGQVKKYVLRTYYGTKAGATDYLVSQSDNKTAFSETLETTGTLAPTGSYYVTTFLMEEVKGDYNGDGEITDDEIADITVGSKEFGDAEKINYTNSAQLSAPQTVTLIPSGNEVLTGSWSEVADADGYHVTIYQQQEDQTWMETGAGYEYDVADFNGSNGLSHENNTFKMAMALTVGGSSEESNGSTTNLALEANKTYKIVVKAYQYLGTQAKTDAAGNTVYEADGVTPVMSGAYPVYGSEKESTGAYLKEYTPLNFELNYNDTVLQPNANGTYEATLGIYAGLLRVSAENMTSLKVIRTDTNEAISVATDAIGQYCQLEPSEFTGAVSLKLIGSQNQGGYVDTTTTYLTLYHDDVAPVLTLDQEVFYADETGNYTITGMAEPGAIIGEEKAAADGTFTVTGSIQKKIMNWMEDRMKWVDEPITYNTKIYDQDSFDHIISQGCTIEPSSYSADVEDYTITTPETEQDREYDESQYQDLIERGVVVTKYKSPLSAAYDADTEAYLISQGFAVTISYEYPTAIVSVNAKDAVGNESKAVMATISPKIKTPTYGVNVVNGSGSGSYEAGKTVQITATEKAGYTFDKWVVTSDNAKLADAAASTTSFTMPTAEVTVTATYTPNTPSWTNPFTDVKMDSWYGEAVKWAVQNEITNGVSTTLFAPERECTRGQVVTFLWRAMGAPEPTNQSSPFVDVKNPKAFYYKAVLWAAEQGVTNGLDSTHFGPDQTVTRGEFVTFLWRAEKKPSSTAGNPFTDVKQGKFYYTAVLWAVENGITNGMTATEFRPSAVCIRAQVVTFLWRDLK